MGIIQDIMMAAQASRLFDLLPWEIEVCVDEAKKSMGNALRTKLIKAMIKKNTSERSRTNCTSTRTRCSKVNAPTLHERVCEAGIYQWVLAWRRAP
jgi:hypothetical protein